MAMAASTRTEPRPRFREGSMSGNRSETPPVTITPGALGSIFVACWGEYPHAAHGLLAAEGEHIVRVLIHATAAAPATTACTSKIDDQRADAALDRARRPLRLAATFHTHLNGPAVPTRDDLDRLPDPSSAPMLIVSLEDLDEPDVRAWTLDDGRPRERALHVATEPIPIRHRPRPLPGA